MANVESERGRDTFDPNTLRRRFRITGISESEIRRVFLQVSDFFLHSMSPARFVFSGAKTEM